MLESLEKRKQIFIEKARKVHGNVYDYSLVEYKRMRDKVKIKCPYCGKYFYQAPMVHVKGQGCPCQKSIKIKEKLKFSQEEFIEKAKKIHNDKYDYSWVKYDGGTTILKLFCNTCKRFFEQKAKTHLMGHGCPHCSSFMSKDEFVKRAKKVHGNKYDYTDTNVYTNEKIKIYCRKCKQYFYQNKNSHLRGKGCPLCSKNKHLTEEEFFYKIKKLFGDKYDYSKAKYIDSKHKIKLYCKKCDIWFEKSTTALLKGIGCQYCSKGTPDTYKIFVEKARKVHGDKFEYDKESFSLTNKKIKIYCKNCNKWFIQKKSKHLSGSGCIECSGKVKYTTEKFIKKSKEIFGENKFDYSKCKYTGMLHKVILICNDCKKEFEICALNHIHGKQGCSNCKSKSQGEDIVYKYLTENNISFETQKCFKDCKNKRNLPFDFYLPDYNTCIEYQGQQHYTPLKFFGGQESFEYRQKCDQIKREYCKKNNIVLLEIKYDENIEEVLKKFKII